MQFGDPQNPFQIGITRTVRVLILVNVGVFVAQILADFIAQHWFASVFALNPDDLVRFHLWQVVTYMFLHANIWHILMNMLMLYFFGSEVESLLGTRRFLRLYLVGGILAGLGWVVISELTGRSAQCVGASGAVYAIVGAFAAMFPDRRITLLLFFVLPVTMTARTMLIGLGVITMFLMISGDGNVAHAAHLAGGVVGVIYGLRMRKNRIFLGVDEVRGEGGGGGDWWSRMRASWRRPKLRLHTKSAEVPTPEEVDQLLEKISAKGIGSLTPTERKALERASEAKKRRE